MFQYIINKSQHQNKSDVVDEYNVNFIYKEIKSPIILKETIQRLEEIKAAHSNTSCIGYGHQMAVNSTKDIVRNIDMDDYKMDDQYKADLRQQYFEENNDADIPIEPIYNAAKRIDDKYKLIFKPECNHKGCCNKPEISANLLKGDMYICKKHRVEMAKRLKQSNNPHLKSIIFKLQTYDDKHFYAEGKKLEDNDYFLQNYSKLKQAQLQIAKKLLTIKNKMSSEYWHYMIEYKQLQQKSKLLCNIRKVSNPFFAILAAVVIPAVAGAANGKLVGAGAAVGGIVGAAVGYGVYKLFLGSSSSKKDDERKAVVGAASTAIVCAVGISTAVLYNKAKREAAECERAREIAERKAEDEAVTRAIQTAERAERARQIEESKEKARKIRELLQALKALDNEFFLNEKLEKKCIMEIKDVDGKIKQIEADYQEELKPIQDAFYNATTDLEEIDDKIKKKIQECDKLMANGDIDKLLEMQQKLQEMEDKKAQKAADLLERKERFAELEAARRRRDYEAKRYLNWERVEEKAYELEKKNKKLEIKEVQWTASEAMVQKELLKARKKAEEEQLAKIEEKGDELNRERAMKRAEYLCSNTSDGRVALYVVYDGREKFSTDYHGHDVSRNKTYASYGNWRICKFDAKWKRGGWNVFKFRTKGTFYYWYYQRDGNYIDLNGDWKVFKL